MRWCTEEGKGKSSRERSSQAPGIEGHHWHGDDAESAVIRLKLCWQSINHRTDIAKCRQDIRQTQAEASLMPQRQACRRRPRSRRLPFT